jgi:hypothetical protein
VIGRIDAADLWTPIAQRELDMEAARRAQIVAVCAAALACTALFGTPSAASATQLRGAVINDVFQLQTMGTAVAIGVSGSPVPSEDPAFLIFSGQQLDAPEAIADFSAELSALKAAGGQITRFTVPWPSLETDPVSPGDPPSWNPLSVARLDAVFRAVHAAGIKVIFNFNNTPCGRSSQPNKNCSVLGGWGTYPPTNEGDLTTAVRDIVNRWGQDIYAVEVWNEPNIAGFFLADKTQCDPSAPADVLGASSAATRAAAYVPMVKATWDGVKSSNFPNVHVAAGVMSLADTRFLQDLYANGMQGSYDAITAHPYQMLFEYRPTPRTCADRSNGYSKLYAETRDPSQPYSDSTFSFKTGIEALHSTMVQNGDNSPLWLTEFGFDACGNAPADVREELGQANSRVDFSGLCVGEGFQSDWLNSSFEILAQHPYVQASTIYQMRDGTLGENLFSLDNWGLLRHDFTPKVAYGTLAARWNCIGGVGC